MGLCSWVFKNTLRELVRGRPPGKRDRGKKPPPNRGRLPVPNPNKATPFLGRGGAEGTDEGPFHGGGRSPSTTLLPGKKFSTKVENLPALLYTIM